LPTILLTNLLHLLHSIPLDDLSARQVLRLTDAIALLNIRENIRPAINEHITRSALLMCPVAIGASRAIIADTLTLVRRYRNQALLNCVMQNLTGGHWSQAINLLAWRSTEKRAVGGLWDVFQYLSAVEPDGIRSSGHMLVEV
jgi:hypothetical protein